MWNIHLVVLFVALVVALTVTPLRAQETPDATVLPMEERLRLRDLPTFGGETLALLEAFAPLTVIGRTADSWWLNVRTADDVQGWVVSEFVLTTIDVTAVPITADLDALAQPYPLAPAVVRRIRETAARGAENGTRPGVF
ncbi:MAG: SH3 domain-containing protein, partial [Anaerolineae bacterium]|nr:SH3 domain-containing protein [Anaerolineae bacterium]